MKLRNKNTGEVIEGEKVHKVIEECGSLDRVEMEWADYTDVEFSIDECHKRLHDLGVTYSTYNIVDKDRILGEKEIAFFFHCNTVFPATSENWDRQSEIKKLLDAIHDKLTIINYGKKEEE